MEKLVSGKVPRYEMKYLIPGYQMEEIRLWLETLCFRDKHVGISGCYNIRSLYFDDYTGSAYRDNEMGIEPRSKYRIRIYNCDDRNIMLEQKIKNAGKIQKVREPLRREFVDALLNDEETVLEYFGESKLLNRFLVEYQSRYLRPVVIVDYIREPYVYFDGDVRITFDSNIGFSGDTKSFFDSNLYLQPILPKGTELLEVKYTEFLPAFIYGQLNLFDLQKCTFSKYFLCEKFRRLGGDGECH